MRIAVFGANGPTGRRLTGRALAAGHEVVAVTRGPGSLPARPGLAAADAADPAAVGAAIGGTEAVLSALGARFSKEFNTTYSASATVSSSIADPNWPPTGAHFFNHVLDPLVNRRLPVVTDHHTAQTSADGVFTARADRAAVEPNIAKLIWNEGVKKK
ncbi:NAD(P)H-binding protein [Streptomyces sp. NPDC056660]|uniref:NAD(P)H-binding protein n=1 Tax=Streptomyces sp. NPDC056660 TaxID=3345897 RepID=UPI0036ACE2EA